jgi:signal transduction histidine kinase
MKDLFSKISLKRIFSLFTIGTTCMLLIVIIFSSKQYFLYQHCEKLVNSSQQLLFQFTGIKEHINVSLLNKKQLNSQELIKEIQGLDVKLRSILEDILIPEEFKLSFISQLELVNITVTLRSVQNSGDIPSKTELASLSTQLSTIHSKINSFYQLISRYTQKQLLRLQQALVGLFAIVIALISIMLLVINKYITSPIIHYCKKQFPDKKDNISLFSLHKTIENLASERTEKVFSSSETDTGELSRLYRYSSIGHLLGGLSHELTNISNGAINYTQALLDISTDLQLDHDSKQLLHKLFEEERKISYLLTNMISFTSGSRTGEAKALSIEELFEQVNSLVRGTFKNEGIELTINLNDPTVMLNNHVSDLQLVILSALQNCRIALNSRHINDGTGLKKISITIDEKELIQQNVTISILDNGAPRSATRSGSGSQGSWHNISFCKAFLGTFGGSLDVSRNHDEENNCTIIVPLHNKQDI